MEKEGVVFEKSVLVGKISQKDAKNFSGKILSPETLENDFDAVLIAGGAEQPRDLPVPGRQLSGVHFAMDFLPLQNMICAGDKLEDSISAKDKHVVVIGGGDTGSDCVGTSNRQGAKSVTQFELMPQPPKEENKGLIGHIGRKNCGPHLVIKRDAKGSSLWLLKSLWVKMEKSRQLKPVA